MPIFSSRVSAPTSSAARWSGDSAVSHQGCEPQRPAAEAAGTATRTAITIAVPAAHLPEGPHRDKSYIHGPRLWALVLVFATQGLLVLGVSLPLQVGANVGGPATKGRHPPFSARKAARWISG